MEIVAVVALLIVAALLRFVALGINPSGLFHDEVEKGYTAFELARTGHHGVLGAGGIEVSRAFPSFIEVYQGHDRTSAIYQYLSAPFVGAFGLNRTTTRLVAALGGWLAVLGVWLAARRWFGVPAGVVALAVMTFHPAGLIFSRWAQQGILVLPLTAFGFVCLWAVSEAAEKHRRAIAASGALLLGLAAYAYAPARLVVPLLVGGFALTVGPSQLKRDRSAYATAAVVFAAFWIPLFVYTLSAGSARLQRVGVFSNGIGSGLGTAFTNYFAHFDPRFLFVSGDANPRHGLPGAGLVGWGTAILMTAAVAVFLRRYLRRQEGVRRQAVFVFLWFLLAPMAAALTNEGIPHALRANLMIPASALIASYAVLWARTESRNKIVYTAIALLLLVDAAESFRGLSSIRKEPAPVWEVGVLEAMAEALEAPGAVYLSAEVPYANYFALFAERTDPAAYQELGLGALRTTIIPPGQRPNLKPGDILVAPPVPTLDAVQPATFAGLYEMRGGELMYREPKVE